METTDTSIIEPIEIRMIRPSLFNVRDKFHKKTVEFENLVSSIRDHGLLQPVVVRPIEHGFEIVAGFRRYEACKSLRWRFIQAKVRDLSDKEAYEIQLTENVQRKSMDPIEEAEAFRKYVQEYGWGGTAELARRIGKSQEYVSHRVQLLKLPEDMKEKVSSSTLSISQALELTNLCPSIQNGNTRLFKHITENNLTVREIRNLKKELKRNYDGTRKSKSTLHEQDLEKEGIFPLYNDEDARDAKREKSLKVLKRATLALKISLSRFDDFIEDAHNVETDQRDNLIRFLMNLRLNTHSMIDETLRYRKDIGKKTR